MPADFPRLSDMPEGLARWWLETRVAVAFLTRLPVPLTDGAHTPLAQAVRGFPLAGLIVGVAGAVTFALAEVFALPTLVSALLAVGAMVLLTGSLHEDGLADTADGLGGGRDRAHALTIMRDSRIGSYGVIALVLALGLRAAAINALAYSEAAGLAMIAAACASRAVLPFVMHYLPPARTDGLAQVAGNPDLRAVLEGAAIGLLVLLLCLGFFSTLLLIVLLALCTVLFMRYLHLRLEGQTGDTLGAVQQGAEIVILIVATTILP